MLLTALIVAGAWLATTSDEDEPATTPTLPTTPIAPQTVPDVIGLRLPEARAQLGEANLDARFRRVPSEQPRNEVLEQQPAADAEPPENGIVVLTVSGGPERVVLPRVEGSTLEEATATLRDAGLRWEAQRMESAEPSGTVVSQTPAAGEEVDRETVVVLEVAERAPAPQPETVEVPRLVGLRSSEARGQLSDLGLRWTQRPLTSSQPQGTVVRQSPGPGADAREGSVVTLTVSTGPPRVDVPDVVGLDVQDARSDLRAAGLRVRVVDEPTVDPTEDGTVLRQRPRAGASRPEGTVVTITVARF